MARKKAPRLLPNGSEIKRAAEALAGRTDGKDHWVLIRIDDNALPVRAEVFESAAKAKKARSARSKQKQEWAVIAGRSDDPEFVVGKTGHEVFFVVAHGELSPMGVAVYKQIDRSQIISIELSVTVDTPAGPRTEAVQLPTKDLNGADIGKPDAIFLSHAALDKYLFPHLVDIYGVSGASKLRGKVKSKITRTFKSQTIVAAIV